MPPPKDFDPKKIRKDKPEHPLQKPRLGGPLQKVPEPSEKAQTAQISEKPQSSLAQVESKALVPAVSAAALTEMVDGERNILIEIMDDNGVPMPRNRGPMQCAPLDINLLKLQLERSELISPESLDQLTENLDEGKLTAFLSGIVLDSEVFDRGVRTEALFMLIARAEFSEEATNALVKFGLTKEKIDELSQFMNSKPFIDLTVPDRFRKLVSVFAGLYTAGMGIAILCGLIEASSLLGLLALVSAVPGGYSMNHFFKRWNHDVDPMKPKRKKTNEALQEVERFEALLTGKTIEETEEPYRHQRGLSLIRLVILRTGEIFQKYANPASNAYKDRRALKEIESETRKKRLQTEMEKEKSSLSSSASASQLTEGSDPKDNSNHPFSISGDGVVMDKGTLALIRQGIIDDYKNEK